MGSEVVGMCNQVLHTKAETLTKGYKEPVWG